MWTWSFRRFTFAILFGGFHSALDSVFQLSRGGMDPNGSPGDGG